MHTASDSPPAAADTLFGWKSIFTTSEALWKPTAGVIYGINLSLTFKDKHIIEFLKANIQFKKVRVKKRQILHEKTLKAILHEETSQTTDANTQWWAHVDAKCDKIMMLLHINCI